MNINNSPEEITNILKKCNYNIESTLDVLLNEPKKAEGKFYFFCLCKIFVCLIEEL